MRKILMSMISMGLMAFATSAQAGSAIGTTVVSTTAVKSCSVDAGSIVAFGTYTGAQIDLTAAAAGSIGVTCNVSGPVFIALDAGAHFAAGSRRMADGAGNFLIYELFQGNQLTTPLGDAGATHPGPVRQFTGSAVFSSLLPARLYARSNFVPGSYSDNVGITLTF